ncbi:MAG TPA: hypothetical protein VF251_10345 [Pyrinomonadaceae bacterium]
MSAPAVDQLRSYFPVDAVIRDGKPQIEWLKMPDLNFREPFFHQTVQRARQSNTSSFTDLEVLLQVAKATPAISPSGFIFHTSRCGSTLVANACRALHATRVIAEAPVIDKLISRLFTDAEPGSTKEVIYLSLIRAAAQSLARDLEEGSRYFVKFACASILQVKALRRTWPDVPFLIMFRDPIDVTVSNLRNPPEWMSVDSNPAAAAAIIGVGVNQLSGMADVEFCARALGRYYAAAESFAGDHKTHLVDYSQLTAERLMQILGWFGAPPSPTEAAEVEHCLISYSKDPARVFRPDTAEKRAAASRQVIEAVEKWAVPLYDRLVSQPVDKVV